MGDYVGLAKCLSGINVPKYAQRQNAGDNRRERRFLASNSKRRNGGPSVIYPDPCEKITAGKPRIITGSQNVGSLSIFLKCKKRSLGINRPKVFDIISITQGPPNQNIFVAFNKLL
jgi:hypothetical protein